jgi:hypothetical protein
MRLVVNRCSIWLATLMVSLLWVGGAAASAPTRLAVVFSNSKYSDLGELRNPAQDGQLIATSLRSAGFDVVSRHDLSDEQFRAALRQLARDSAKYDVTLVYYAGHGVQLDGVNYLLPVDIKPPEQADDIRLGSVSADEVLSVIKSRYRILVLDACRENPILGRTLNRGRGIGYKQGLAPVSPISDNAVGGVFVAYSTQADAVAQDGEGVYSPFAESFSKHVGANASIDDMFALVTRDVLQATKGFQRPFKYASMDAVFCLTGTCAGSDLKGVSGVSDRRNLLAGDSQELTTSLRQIATARPEAQRASIEQSLSDQLLAVLPQTVPYGTSKMADGKTNVYGFVPSSVHYQGSEVTVTIRAFNLGDNAGFTDTGWMAHEVLNCKNHQLIQMDWAMNGDVKIFTRDEQKANAVALADGSVGQGLEGALCTPLRFVPLWAIDNLDWLRIGPKVEIARGITFQESADSDIHFILGRLDLDPIDSYGGNTAYGWLEINCSTKEFNANTHYSLKKDGSILGVYGNPGKWQAIAETSPAHNAYVLLCDKAR